MPTALITGAAGGIGSAIAAALAPTHTLLLAGRPSARLDALAERLGAPTWPLDLTDADSIESATEVLAELDVLVHNAGVLYPGRVAESIAEQWRASFEVNVTGAVALTLALLPALRAAGGHVVFINSGAGQKVSAGMASYSASKFALRAFADSLRADEPSLRVTSIFPGRVDTEMQRDLVAYENAVTDGAGEYDPAKFLKPETVAGLAATAVTTPPDGHVHEIVVRPG
ncbi:SDR family oxidoreductase [Mycolicibacterium fortuitum]|uniref:Short chain dehydrogenase n=1 Tax=Mycolicibacterium fortuitum subsp. fortuitum DSM 46621 = ATCC 6841 = JCM 6387 TaxID=1214102 RepID=K0UWM6_MYCFO|nr:SDR family oxidoreductase [Mycolicibacterium fortuitum]AIY49046.1 Short chain dehydrogenase [Mycobacterium sp. VKM Ac-1817D]EJZ09425.1 short chain dehydrogenase [Mycolicibacterium fortuitum subsp. fortuitum DSM 46621 = ATCC 6841 = JCM 6387]WEV32841.1 SDR family oxidoreductase [Mycolicibacterium fortuitum]CRL53253.1 short chain dehydrogenase [Mycolicibacterium fortuitum subsp. fortuitum DSM 46621 = ATCC 6841 = JCM 6387]BDE02049.1 short chain dehydrogenase [Mycolicibacterium fortuitum subsp. 